MCNSIKQTYIHSVNPVESGIFLIRKLKKFSSVQLLFICILLHDNLWPITKSALILTVLPLVQLLLLLPRELLLLLLLLPPPPIIIIIIIIIKVGFLIELNDLKFVVYELKIYFEDSNVLVYVFFYQNFNKRIFFSYIKYALIVLDMEL
jgi:hypothetical protein